MTGEIFDGEAEIEGRNAMSRKCGDCQLCCRLLPMDANSGRAWDKHPELKLVLGGHRSMPEFDKPAGVRCPFQKHHKGCTEYARRPMGCRVWNCVWLANAFDDAKDLQRPDRSHYVVDTSPDFIGVEDPDTGEKTPVEVVQVWVDPRHRDAHRDPELRKYLIGRNMPALIRWSRTEGMVIIPPGWSSTGEWVEFAPGTAALPAASTWPEDMRRHWQEVFS